MSNKSTIFTYKEMLVNPSSVCIFADCSFDKYNEPIYDLEGKKRLVGDTAPAYCVYIGDYMVEQRFEIIRGLTSQEGEHYAVFLAIQAAWRYRNFPHIRIFSDSLTTITALRERNIKYMYEEPNRLANTTQKYVIEPMYAIMQTGIPIEFYHVSGHMNQKSEKDLMHAKESFEQRNPWVGEVDIPLIRYTIMGNCATDEYSTAMLRTYAKPSPTSLYHEPKEEAIEYFYRPFTQAQIEYYKSLTFYSKDRWLDEHKSGN